MNHIPFIIGDGTDGTYSMDAIKEATVSRSSGKQRAQSRHSDLSDADPANVNRPQSNSRSRSQNVAATPSDSFSGANSTKGAVIGRGKEALSILEQSNSDVGESDDAVIWVQRRPPNAGNSSVSRSISSADAAQKSLRGSRSHSRSRIDVSGHLDNTKDVKHDIPDRISETSSTDDDYVPPIQKTASRESKYVPQSI
jgi:hypothetical protein